MFEPWLVAPIREEAVDILRHRVAIVVLTQAIELRDDLSQSLVNGQR